MGADSADSSTAGCGLIITLVHGTWGRGFFAPLREEGTWFTAGSDFRKALAGALNKHRFSFSIYSFLWSGANSVRERDKAAHELAEHLRAKQLENSDSTQVVIGHSHGGNVALRALDQPELNQENILLATIATPFVEILRSKLSPKETQRLLISLLIVTIVFFLFPFHYFIIMKLLINKQITEFTSIIIVMSFFLVFALLFRPLVSTWGAKRSAKIDELCKLTSLSSSIRRHPLLILRALDDEASLVLAAGAIGNRLSALIGSWSYRIFLFLMMLLGVPLLLFALFYLTIEVFRFESFIVRVQNFLGPLFGSWVPPYFTTLGWLFVLGLIALIAFLLLPGAFKSVYGKELLFNSQDCQINSQSVPDSIDRQSEFHSCSKRPGWATVITLHRLDEVRRGRRHGLYNDPQCAERIAAWLQNELDRRGT